MSPGAWRRLGVMLGVAMGIGGGAASAGAQPLPDGLRVVDPASEGMSAPALERATAVLQGHIDAGDIGGVVAAVVRNGRLVYLQALGHRDLEAGDPMSPDALFRIYSMTRPVTALGILMLADEGLVELDAPVQRYLPAFADQRVLAPGDGDGATRPRVGDVTLAQLLTHTSGIGSRSSGLYRERDVHGWDRSLTDVVDAVAAAPLFEDPGTRYRYGMSAEVLGRVIEVVTGMPVDVFLARRIFEPLGMTDAVFHVDAERQGRLVPVYRRNDEGRLAPIQMETIPVTEPRALTSSGVGLVTSTLDFLRFGQLFLDGGEVDGRPFVGSEIVRRMAENAVPDALLPLGENGYWAGSGWSLGGMAVALDPAAYAHTIRPGTFWWDGSTGTRFWIDPEENMVTIVMAQISPAGGNGFRERFMTAVYEAIDAAR